ncbi:MAG: tRNA (cytidine(34)-2'-O)-methyltransferase [Gammaproteobacteria bacterium]|jgi:tRNA (cytidine/uridine-2'-O-)-methyltransferase
MFDLILYEPEIPPNTGNVIRLCANVGASLHLVHPLGFEMEARQLRRAGLDYHELVNVREHESLEACLLTLKPTRLFALSTKGTETLFEQRFTAGDAFLLGPETRGLPDTVLSSAVLDGVVRVPMREQNRSLNLSNTAAVVLYEAWRQLGFPGGV